MELILLIDHLLNTNPLIHHFSASDCQSVSGKSNMLVLSRKPGESVTIGDEVRITVLSISGKQVRIGIEAPSDVAVHREEIYKKIAKEQSSNAEVEDTD